MTKRESMSMVRKNSAAAGMLFLLLAAGNTGLVAAQTPAARPALVPLAQHTVAPADLAAAASAGGSYAIVGAAAGLVVGGGLTWIIIHHGGSTSLCDRSANQDAIRANECLAIAAGGAVVGAAVGYFIGSRIRRGRRAEAPFDALRLGVAPAGNVRIGWQLAY
jgi:hypothetical protein